ncbi:hypothetical protein WKH57_01270 [Niallia taxi]|uniref:hypothetical protein n=1 Tax=Niallia taxi TaxID=2499688 RepID=UPI00317790C6
MLIGECKIVFYTEDNNKEDLNVETMSHANLNYISCNGTSGVLKGLDIIDLIVYDNPEDDEE